MSELIKLDDEYKNWSQEISKDFRKSHHEFQQATQDADIDSIIRSYERLMND